MRQRGEVLGFILGAWAEPERGAVDLDDGEVDARIRLKAVELEALLGEGLTARLLVVLTDALLHRQGDAPVLEASGDLERLT